MAVTTGSTTGSTSASNKTSSNPSGGGPGGGSLSAPARTAPSTSTGGQSSASKASSSPASKTSPTAPSKSSSSSAGASKPSNPTGGSLSAPARTAPSAGGITSRTPSQQAAVDKAKQSYSQYGGAQTSMRQATNQSLTGNTQSAKVTDPSRGPTSPMSGQGTSYSTPQDAKKANTKYADTWGDYNRFTKGAPSAMADIEDIRGRMGPFKGPGKNGEMYEYDGTPFNPNNPWTRQDNTRGWRDIRDEADSFYRGMKGVAGIDDDERTPQEVREVVQRQIDRENTLRGEQVRKSYVDSLAASAPNAPKPNIRTPDIAFSQSGKPGLIGRSGVNPSGTDTAWGGDPVNPQTSAPGKTSNVAKQPSSNLLDKGNPEQQVAGGKTANAMAVNGSATAGPWGGRPSTSNVAAKTDKQPSPTVARPTSASLTGSGTSTQWGGRLSAPGKTDRVTPQTSAPGRDDRQTPQTTAPGRDDRQTPQTVAPGKTGMAPSPTVARPSENFIDSIMGAQPNPRQPTASQVLANDVITPYGPRAGTTPATPASHPALDTQQAVTQLQDLVQKAKQGTLLSDYAPPQPPQPKIVDRVPRNGPPTDAITNPFGTRPPAAAARQLSLQTRVGIDDLLANPPAQRPQAIPAPDTIGMTGANRQPTTINIGMPTSVSGGLGFPGYAAPPGMSSQRLMGTGPSNTTQQRNEMYGGGPSLTASPIVDGALSPSQEGSYPADENFVQDDGQPQSLRELKNRAGYEYGQAKQGVRDLPARLWDAITKGDIRGMAPQNNDRNQRRQLPRPDQVQLSQSDAAVVARLAALVKKIEQDQAQGLVSQQQADLINSTFQ